jgi:hypothetical protein
MSNVDTLCENTVLIIERFLSLVALNASRRSLLQLKKLGTKRALSQVLRIYALVIFGRGLTRYWSTVGLLEGSSLNSI